MFGIQSSCMLCHLSSTTSLWGCPERGRIPPSHMLCSLLNPSTPALMDYGPQTHCKCPLVFLLGRDHLLHPRAYHSGCILRQRMLEYQAVDQNSVCIKCLIIQSIMHSFNHSFLSLINGKVLRGPFGPSFALNLKKN